MTLFNDDDTLHARDAHVNVAPTERKVSSLGFIAVVDGPHGTLGLRESLTLPRGTMLPFGRFFRRTDEIVERVALGGIRTIVELLVVQTELGLMQQEIVRQKPWPVTHARFLRWIDTSGFASTILTVRSLDSTSENLNKKVATLTTVMIGEILGAWIMTTDTRQIVRSEKIPLRVGVRGEGCEVRLGYVRRRFERAS